MQNTSIDVQIKEERKKEICDSLARSGTYEHTFEELQWGARVAWRNHGASAHRSHWNEVMLLDHRAADTPAKMFEVRQSRAKGVARVLVSCSNMPRQL